METENILKAFTTKSTKDTKKKSENFVLFVSFVVEKSS